MSEYITVSANGLSFNVATAGEGPRLALALHGFPQSAASYRQQMPLLAKLGYRVWVPDLRGYGQSSRPKGVDAYTMQLLEADVAGLIEASGADQVTLIGHDWGGAIAWNVAMHGARKLERLIILNVPHPACFEAGLRTLRQLRRSWYMLFFQLPWLPERLLGAFGAAGVERMLRYGARQRGRFSADALQEYRRNALEPDALTAMLNYYRAIPRSLGKLRARGYPKIEIPTLMLWGEEDVALGKELTYETSRYVSDLTLRYLPGVSHWVTEEASDSVNALIEAWLTDQPVPEASRAPHAAAGNLTDSAS